MLTLPFDNNFLKLPLSFFKLLIVSFKTVSSIHNICIASIKRKTMKPYDFKWTKFYTLNQEYFNAHPNIKFDLQDDELIICSTVVDEQN